MYYDLFGSINTLFIFISLFGIFSQLTTIWHRKSQQQSRHKATELLSLNQFSVSFLAYLSFFIYGYSIQPFNHYIVWPRLIAALIIGFILYEIWRDRKTSLSQASFVMVLITVSLSLIGLVFGERFSDQGRTLSTGIILVISALIAQGYWHQIRLIIRSGATGAVDKKMSQFILLMDVSTLAFALSMGLNTGWPLMVLAITSAITKIIILYLFRWVEISPVALDKRAANANSLVRKPETKVQD